LQGETEILRNRIAQLEDDIKGIKAQQHAKERQIALIREEAKSLKSLLDKGHTDRPRYLALQCEMARLEGERGEHISAIARTTNEIGEMRLPIIQLERTCKEQVETDLRAVADELVDLQERRIVAQHTLDHVEIRAPITGTVVGLSVHALGGVIAPGATVLEIVPLDDQLIVEAQIQPNDIDDLVVGQLADVKFAAFKQRTAPVLVGEVVYRSADRLVNERTGEPFYLVLAVSDQELERLGERRLQPGMPADVMIKTGERTALQYLFQPLLDNLEHAWREG
jgi:HlyD family secretion protein/epimerase transport system membrane fusion protein